MEALHILLNQVEQYDELVHKSLPQSSDVTICTKDRVTVGGLPGAVIAFEVTLPDGTRARAQATVTVRNLQMLGSVLFGRYGDLSAPMPLPAGKPN